VAAATVNSVLLLQIAGSARLPTDILRDTLRKNKVPQRRLLIVELSPALRHIVIGAGHAAVEGVEEIPHGTVLTLCPISSHVAFSGHRVCQKRGRTGE